MIQVGVCAVGERNRKIKDGVLDGRSGNGRRRLLIVRTARLIDSRYEFQFCFYEMSLNLIDGEFRFQGDAYYVLGNSH